MGEVELDPGAIFGEKWGIWLRRWRGAGPRTRKAGWSAGEAATTWGGVGGNGGQGRLLARRLEEGGGADMWDSGPTCWPESEGMGGGQNRLQGRGGEGRAASWAGKGGGRRTAAGRGRILGPETAQRQGRRLNLFFILFNLFNELCAIQIISRAPKVHGKIRRVY
uniref:Uncharacterized protein n=1 Tax=Oryza sativa subsp. japonica TaxID=39947 RepID=Q7XHL4_ORYSJ|nr:hypothetical protein [Oryza sativa Japonica Group]BAD30829.1 hypothetical protein [Oryza sativa Japonica Group]